MTPPPQLLSKGLVGTIDFATTGAQGGGLPRSWCKEQGPALLVLGVYENENLMPESWFSSSKELLEMVDIITMNGSKTSTPL